ncbi:hypothetical protein BDW75DRAFT_200028 [Aspergillus navahoensis]
MLLFLSSPTLPSLPVSSFFSSTPSRSPFLSSFVVFFLLPFYLPPLGSKYPSPWGSGCRALSLPLAPLPSPPVHFPGPQKSRPLTTPSCRCFALQIPPPVDHARLNLEYTLPFQFV